MKYTIENSVAIIKQGLVTKRLELDKITKVVWDRKIKFFDGEKFLMRSLKGNYMRRKPFLKMH